MPEKKRKQGETRFEKKALIPTREDVFVKNERPVQAAATKRTPNEKHFTGIGAGGKKRRAF